MIKQHQTPTESDEITETEKEKEKTTLTDCPLCGSTLIGEALREGKCQCCGHQFESTNASSPQS